MKLQKARFQMGTVLGVTVGVGSLVVSILMETFHLNPNLGTAYLKISAILIIIGGSAGATMLSIPFGQFMNSFRTVFYAFSHIEVNQDEIAETLVNWGQTAKREGLLALERYVEEIQVPLLRMALRMVVDGADPHMIRDIVYSYLDKMTKRHRAGADVFTLLGGYSPTMGIIGTVVGLIGALSEAGEGGESGKVVAAIATAFIATFYGISLANLVFLPIGNRLKTRSDHERFILEVEIAGLLSIQQGENPAYVRDRVNSYFALRASGAAASPLAR